MSMVEHVAQAMAENAGFNWEYCAQSQWKDDARAGIEAMRAMVPVVRDEGRVVHELRGSPASIWSTLLDAALEQSIDGREK